MPSMEGMDMVMETPSYVWSILDLLVLNLALWEEVAEEVEEVVVEEEEKQEEVVEEKEDLGEDLDPQLEDLNSGS